MKRHIQTEYLTGNWFRLFVQTGYQLNYYLQKKKKYTKQDNILSNIPKGDYVTSSVFPIVLELAF